MAIIPTRTDLSQALTLAGRAHHAYEAIYLNNELDQQWPGFYAAYVLGRLGDFAGADQLATWLGEVDAEEDWTDAAAKYVIERIETDQ